MNTAILSVMTLSVCFQFVAALMAIRMIRLSGFYSAWVLLACGFVVQGGRRAVALWHLVSGVSHEMLIVELMGLLISILMVIGIWKFRPLFVEIKLAHQALQEKHKELAERNLELHDNRKMLQRIIDKAHTQLVYLDADFRFIAVNSAYTEGCRRSAEELVGRYLFDIFPDAENEHIFRLAKENRRAISFHDKPVVFPDQPERGVTWWDSTVTPLLDDSGAVEALLLSLVETTHRKRMEDELRVLNTDLEQRVVDRTADLQRLNKELESFCYSISHEIRAPIARLLGFSEIMAEATSQPEEVSFIAQRIGAAGLRLRSVVDSLLLMNRLSRAEIRVERVNLSLLAVGAVKELLEDASGRSVEVRIAPDMVVNGDRSMLEICMRNLLGNALKFSSKKEKARIEFDRTEISGEKVYFVRDNGAGFDVSFAGKLFVPFCRLHTEDEFEGSGMGLPTVHRIMERHGGRIWAEAEPGEGATFFFTMGDSVGD